MAYSVNAGFNEFLTKLTPNVSESEAAKSHRQSIESVLKRIFGIINFFRSGSFGNGTSISGHSDVDYFAHIPVKKVKSNSGTMLSDVRDVLNNRFPRTGVRVNTPAVLVPFGTDVSENTEVVPAKMVSLDEDLGFIYGIADGSGNWINSCPKAHNQYVSSVNDKLDKKLKPLIRFIKAWKYYLNVPISSFYLELFVTNYMDGDSLIWYSIDIKRIIGKLYDDNLPDVRDPTGISDYISPCSSSAKKDETKTKLLTAYTRAKFAREAEEDDKNKDAFYWWDKFYGGNFTSYG